LMKSVVQLSTHPPKCFHKPAKESAALPEMRHPAYSMTKAE